MLFNSYSFLFGFLPLTLLGYQIAAHRSGRSVVRWLGFVSLAFYGCWRPAYLFLLCGSIVFNYVAGSLISRKIRNSISTQALLWTAIALNLLALCYFKYLVPSLNRLAAVMHSPHQWVDIVLPLGISFFTFTQIAYLVDLEQGAAKQQDFESYVLFVTFFPHLIAGPILHHSEVMPQFQKQRDFRLRADDLAVGLAWFTMGLFKKVILADRFATDADAAFEAAGYLHAGSAWLGVISYSVQLYFDFSGYSDMALGLARMFSIDFPLNFSSPYKSRSIIDFWQRWHMTLTRYINEYVYNPISVWINRRRVRQGKSISRKATATPEGFAQLVLLPTTVTLFLAGVWHGAGFQFVIFGLLHAFYLSVNHVWRVWRGAQAARSKRAGFSGVSADVAGLLLTYVCVLIAQVFFRAAGNRAALAMIGSMLGRHQHLTMPAHLLFRPGADMIVRVACALFVVWTMPNTQQILARFRPSLRLAPSDLKPGMFSVTWRPVPAWSLAVGVLLLFTLVKMQTPSAFLYFQF